jgi:hypothetical protein
MGHLLLLRARSALVWDYRLCSMWSMALYGAKTWTVRAVDQKHLESFECDAGEEWRKSIGLIV